MPGWKAWSDGPMPGVLGRLLCIVALLFAAPALAAEEPAREAVAALNAARTARGLAPVTERRELMRAARAHADDLARDGGLARSTGPALRDRFERAGYVPADVQALVTFGYPSADLLVEVALGEELHAGILLDPDVGEIGVGYDAGPFRNAEGQTFGHAWVILLSKTRFQPVPDAVEGLLAAINRARGERGLPPVAPAVELAAAAMDHARDMVARGFVAHRSPDGGQPADRARRRRYDFRVIGENLAAGLRSPEDVVQGWTDSPGHAAIMYGADFREVGVGYLAGPVVEAKRSHGHVWVAVFGTRR